jgi:predicted Zn-ribbon and HTH transcriptional regulator
MAMKEVNVKMRHCVCQRCGHEWDSKKERPKECVFCKSYKWDQPIRD